MSWIFHTRAAFAAVALIVAPEVRADPETPAEPLSADALKNAVRTESLSIPTPGELMAALNKVGKPDWSAEIRPPISTNFSNRIQMALNIGGLIADGYIAVEAEDAQQVKNVGADILALAKPLSVQQDIINRGKSLTDFAEQGQWNTLKEEFEATQNEVKSAMTDNKDEDLVTLVTVGGWVRGSEVVTDYLTRHYTENGAKLLRQPAIVHFLWEKLNALPEKVRDFPVVKVTRGDLMKIEQAVSFAPDQAPSADAVKDLNKMSSDLMKEISKKEAK